MNSEQLPDGSFRLTFDRVDLDNMTPLMTILLTALSEAAADE